MQHISEKIQNLLKTKRLEQNDLAAATSYDWRHLSRKLNERKVWSLQKTRLAAEFLGVTADYLRDSSRVFNVGDEVPEDAVIKKLDREPNAPTSEDAIQHLARTQEMLIKTLIERGASPGHLEGMMREMMEQINRLSEKVDRLEKSNQP